ncbi:glycoside hydrolase family 2 TIM barrel-domain containing protein [Mariniflexile soesokkakense]|uniref:Glycoside hydrolase family 2 TIM barrel-domain containing protein n=1 Tax=Mariniflexile soesokkakense TaxID=1343160 RepID=A0ABV0AFA5_9FLAO
MKSNILYKVKHIAISLFCVVFSLENFAQNTIINSGWQFSENETQWETVNLPHTWNINDAFDDVPGYRRGLGYYKKKVYLSSEEKGRIHYLKFNAVNQEATVFVNGKLIGNHKGGYTAFNFDVSEFINYDAYNLIEVTVDNSHNENIPPLDADFTFYGGIYRDVEFISISKQHFSLDDFASDGFYVNYYNVSEEKAGVTVTCILNNRATINLKTKLRLDLLDAEGNLVKTRTELLKLPAETSNEFKIKLPEVYNPKLWSPEIPYLYHLQLVLTNEQGVVLDSKLANIGFRWIGVDAEKGFFLNGKPIKLVGVNRHQDFNGFGNAVAIELQKKDIEIIKNMGGNFLRFAHYPHARELYDMCDKLGIMVWTEIPVVNKVTDTEAFFTTSLDMQKEHIKQYYNYPSVAMIGYMNEIFLRLAFDNKSSEDSKQQLKTTTLKLANDLEVLTRRLAPNHITVMAGHLNEVYNETGIADLPKIFGWNLYFGWYDKDIPDLGVFLDNQHERYPNRSLLLSEYGPGADVRIFTRTPKKFDFSWDYQAKLHQSYYEQIMNRPFMTGMAAWNFADFGSEFRGDPIPHVNQKGLVQYDRTPKEIYYWYKSVLDKKEPFIHISSDYLSGLTVMDDQPYPVQIFSNQKRLSVFLNGQKLEDVTIENGYTTVCFLFKNGINLIKVVSADVSHEKSIEVLNINALNFKDFDRFGINLGSHFYFRDETQKLTFVPDQVYQKGWFGYFDGKPFGMTKDKNQGIPNNIKNTTSDPLFQTMLEGCTSYKADIPEGTYKISLFFVEPNIKPVENIYNLSGSDTPIQNKGQRVFDIYINDVLIHKEFNMAKEYPEKYGITLTSIIKIVENEDLIINLKPIEGNPVISGILIEKQH